MKTLLVINCSGRVSRSLSRRLTHRFAQAWLAHQPSGRIIERDLGSNPPPPVNERWIAAAFADPAESTDASRDALRLSETLIEEIVAADTVIIGTPIYNFGMPAQLKAYFDQVVRVGRTFAFAPGEAEPYRPMLASKPVIAVSAAGDGAMHPGGKLWPLNFLEPHLATTLAFIGLTDLTFVRVGYDEYKDERLKRSLAAAEAELDRLAARQPEAVCR